MVKMLKKIKATSKPLNKEDANKIYVLLKTYETGSVEFSSSYSGLHSSNAEIKTVKEIEVRLTSDSPENLKQLEKEFDSKIKESLGDKVRILSSN